MLKARLSDNSEAPFASAPLHLTTALLEISLPVKLEVMEN